VAAKSSFLFIGTGVSGGEEGARYGPSLMPGGHPDAWPPIKKIFQSIAAQTDGEPCCDWVGEEGAGHYVKMVHNGIEYGDMQLICEVSSLALNSPEKAARPLAVEGRLWSAWRVVDCADFRRTTS